MLKPRTLVPDFSVKLMDGSTWTLSEQKPETFTMIFVYRGYHCPICSMFLPKIKKIAAELAERGVNLLITSSDEKDRAELAVKEWNVDGLPMSYGLSIEDARKLGLYVSASIGKTSSGVEEPDLFAEPGFFMIRPDQTLYFSDIQTMPFIRPDLSNLLFALDTIKTRNYPARGEA